MDPNPSLMAKCIQTTNEVPTAWAAFRDGAEKVPMCPSAQNDSSFHSEIVIENPDGELCPNLGVIRKTTRRRPVSTLANLEANAARNRMAYKATATRTAD